MANQQDRTARRLIDDPTLKHMLGEVADFALYELDAEGVCIGWEAHSAHYQLARPEEIIGQRLDIFYPARQRADGRYDRYLAMAAEQGEVSGEAWRYRKDGTPRWMRFNVAAQRNEAGELTGYLGISYDLTRQHRSDRALEASEQALHFLTGGLKDHSICMLDVNGYVADWNEGAERLHGYAADEIIGEHFSIFHPEPDGANGLPGKALAAALADGRYEADGRLVRKDGSRFLAHVLIEPLHDARDRFVGFAMMTRDVTQRQRAAEELAATQEALNQSEKMRALGELTGGIAHDFNNLLTVIRGAGELLLRGTLDEARERRQLEAIVRTADRAAELTSQLLSFARRQPLRPRPLDLNEEIGGMLEMLRRTIGARIRFDTRLASHLWPVMADPVQLRSVVLNAALNARDAMNGEGVITLATENIAGTGGDEVRLSIVDDGAGMDEETCARAFEPFFSTKPVGQGTGLGLSHIYGFAGQSGGRAELESAIGEGTTLGIRLPRFAAAEAREEARARPAGDGDLAYGTRVLLVEDSRTVASFAQALLEDMGCEIVHAANAEEALAALDQEDFDVLFSDIVMPGLSGLELAARVRAALPAMPILLATGYSEAAARGEGGEFPILPKPYRREALSKMLGKTIEANRLAA